MRIVLASAMMFAACTPAFATTFISGNVASGTSSTVNATVVNGSDSNSTLAPAPISASSSALATDGTDSVNSFASVQATWASADSGTVQIQWGWTIAAPGSAPTIAETNQAPTNWSYTFTASGNGSFDGAYFVIGSGDTFGLQPIYGSGDFPFGPYGGDDSDPTGSGAFSIPLVDGQTYTMALFNFGNIESAGGLVATAGAGAGFGWAIHYVAVPEPAGWALMLSGFGLLGAAARRRRAAHA